jgi:hypothetical protein
MLGCALSIEKYSICIFYHHLEIHNCVRICKKLYLEEKEGEDNTMKQ